MHFLCNRKVYEIDGRKWLLNDKQNLDMGMIKFKSYEPATWALLSKIIQPGWTVIDVGANIGFYTVLFSELVGPTGKVITVEPMLEPYLVMLENCALNNCTNVTPRCLGLYSHNETRDMRTGFSWHLEEAANPQIKNRPVRLASLDSLTGELGISRLDLLKVDTDGYEIHAMWGAMQLLRGSKPYILLEVCDYTLRAKSPRSPDLPEGSHAIELLRFMRSMGYDLLQEEDGLLIEDEEIWVASHDNLSKKSCNILCVHKDAPADFWG